MNAKPSSNDWPLTERVIAARDEIRERWTTVLAADARYDELRLMSHWALRPFYWTVHKVSTIANLLVFPLLWLNFLFWWILRVIVGAVALGLILGVGILALGLLLNWFNQPNENYNNISSTLNYTDTSPAPIAPKTSTTPSYYYPSASYSSLNHNTVQLPAASNSWTSSLERISRDPQAVKFIGQCLTWIIEQSTGEKAPKDVHVRSYVDRNGRYVPEYYRSSPDSAR